MIRLTSLDTLRLSAAEVTDRVEAFDIEQWASAEDGGDLPRESARAFGRWLDSVWTEFAEDASVTVEQVLDGAVTDWCGGRVMPS